MSLGIDCFAAKCLDLRNLEKFMQSGACQAFWNLTTRKPLILNKKIAKKLGVDSFPISYTGNRRNFLRPAGKSINTRAEQGHTNVPLRNVYVTSS
jgi:hypothetical protein